MTYRATVRGVRASNQKIKTIDHRLNSETDARTFRWARKVRKEFKRRVPVGNTGGLRRSADMSLKRGKKGQLRADIGYFVNAGSKKKPNASQARAVEYGTRYQRAQYPLGRATRTVRNGYRDDAISHSRQIIVGVANA